MIFNPTQVSGETTFASVTAGHFHSCALEADGTAWCWGEGSNGALGNNSTETARVPGLVSTQVKFSLLEGGSDNTCGVTPGGLAYCWGRNVDGQLGDGSTEISNFSFVPVRVAAPIG